MVEMEEVTTEETFATRHTVVLAKTAKRSLGEDKITEQIERLRARILTAGRVSKGWRCEWSEKAEVESLSVEGPTRARGNAPVMLRYTVILHLVNSPARVRKASDVEHEFRNIVSMLVAASNTFPNWEVALVDDIEPTSLDLDFDAIKDSGESDYVGYTAVNVPQNWKEAFAHIYDRDAQIDIAMSSIQAGLDSDWSKRFHALFVGPPACGKTEVGTSIRRLLGFDAVLSYDGTALTHAGFIKDLAEREELPRIIFIEEIEKVPEPAVLSALLGMMDTRGEIRKTTAREKIVRDCRVVVFATCNDYEKLVSMQAGALASRFGEPVYFPRPSRDLMGKILRREITQVNGSFQWIEPVLDYMDELESSDPRKAISFALRGRDGWIDGTFADKLRHVRRIGASTNG